MKYIKDSIVKYGETLIIGDLLRLEEDADGRVSIRAVSSGIGAINLDDLGDVTISSPITNNFVRYNGSQWVNVTITSGNLPDSGNYLRLDGSTPMAGNLSMQSYQITFGATGASAALNMNNRDIINIGNLQINDPGPNEGIVWTGGSGWKIYESPDALTNFGGNLQIVLSGTRIATWDILGGYTQVIGPITVGNATTPVAVGQDEFVATDGTRQAVVGVDATRGLFGMRSNHEFSLMTSNTRRWTIDVNGRLLAVADDTYDIGATGATRPRTGYFSDSIVIGTDPGGSNSLRIGGSAWFNADLGDGYVRIDGDSGVADQGGILLDNSSSASRHMKMTATFTGSPGTSSRFRMGWVNSGDKETFINGAAFEIGPAYQMKLFASGTGSLVVGSDPGNTETVRLGGTVRIGDISTSITGSGLVLANTAASASNITMVAGGRIDMPFYDSAAALDTKRWDISVDGVGGPGSFSFVTRKDDGTAGIQWLRALRTAQIVTQVLLTASGTIALLDTTSWRPGTDGGTTLGNASTRWDDIFTRGSVNIYGVGAEPSLRFTRNLTNNPRWDLGRMNTTALRWVYSDDITSEFEAMQLTAGAVLIGRDTSGGTRWTLGPSGGATGFELGRTDNTAASAFIDFHSSSTSVDYDVRVIVQSGTGANGGGSLTAIASSFIYQIAAGSTIALLDATSWRPSVTGAVELGSSTQRWGKLWGEDADFSQNIIVSGAFSAAGGILTASTSGAVVIAGALAELALTPRTGGGAKWELYTQTTASFRLYHAGDQYIFSDTEFTPSVTGGKKLGITGTRWSELWLSGDATIGSLGTFDSTYTPAVDNILIYSGTKWIPRYFQPNFTSGQVIATNLGDGTSATYVNDGRTPAGSPTAPTGVQDPVATAHYRAIIVDMSAYGALPSDKVFVLDYSVNGAAYSTNAIISTSNKVVHSNLDPVKTYAYKYKIRGSSDSVYSDPSNTVSPSNNSEVNAFGVVIASQIATANLSSISANIGDIAAGQVRNPANTVGILFSGTLPGSWTTYMNLVSTGSNPLFHHPGLDLLANGSAIFSGTVNAGYLTIGSGVVNGSLFVSNNISASLLTIIPPTGTGWSLEPSNPIALSYGLTFRNGATQFLNLGGNGFNGVYANNGFAAGYNFISNTFLINSGVSINSGTIGCGGDIWNPLVIFSGSGTQLVDWRRGNVQKLILKATGQTIKLAQGNVGGVYTLLLFQDAVGGRTVTSWISDDANTDVVWSGSGIAPTLSTGGNKIDIISFVKTKGTGATDHYLGVTGGQNYSG